TPILNPGESAILGVGAIKEKPWVVDGQVVPRQVASLSLSFDHRLIDGALGAELLRDVSAVLEDPSLGLVWAERREAERCGIGRCGVADVVPLNSLRRVDVGTLWR